DLAVDLAFRVARDRSQQISEREALVRLDREPARRAERLSSAEKHEPGADAGVICHGRACPGHPRLPFVRKDVDARHKAGQDSGGLAANPCQGSRKCPYIAVNPALANLSLSRKSPS